MRATLSKWGNSLAIRLPKQAADSAGFHEGGVVDLTVEDGAVVLRRRKWDIQDLVQQIDGADQPPLIADDAPRGSEEW